MKTKIRTKVGENPLTNPKARRFLREQSLSIVQNALPKMKDRLNKTEEPDSDPRKSHVDVKKWVIHVRYQHPDKDELSYSVGIRATNTQLPSSYTAFRTKKTPTNLEEKAHSPKSVYVDKRGEVLSREEIERIYRIAKLTRKAVKNIKGTNLNKPLNKISRAEIYKQYKKLIPVKVQIDNIAFSRLFSAKNTIKPNPSKYGPYSYASCLKIWNRRAFRFEYATHSYPKANNGKYYRSRIYVMKETINDAINSISENDSGEWK